MVSKARLGFLLGGTLIFYFGGLFYGAYMIVINAHLFPINYIVGLILLFLFFLAGGVYLLLKIRTIYEEYSNAIPIR